MKKQLAIISSAIFLLFSCGPNAEEKPSWKNTSLDTIMDAEGMMDESAAVGSSLENQDSASQMEEDKFIGKMLVHCPDSMIEEEQSTITMAIGRDINMEKIIEEISDSEGITQMETTEESKIFNPTLTKAIRVSILFDDKDFELISGGMKKEIFINPAETKDADWLSWNLKPLQPGVKKISFSIENKINDNWEQIQSERKYNIIVTVNKTIIPKKIYTYIKDNPKETLFQILIPFITFLFGRVSGKKNKRI